MSQLLAFPDVPTTDAEPDVEHVVAGTVASLMELMCDGWHMLIKWSGGKDSTAMVNLALTAARRLKEKGDDLPPILVTSSDTGIDNPEMARSRVAEARKMREYAERHDIPLRVEIVRPDLINTWPVQVIGRGALPIFPNARQRRCSVEMKKLPQQRFCKEYVKALGRGAKVLNLIGIRRSESVARAQKMRGRGDNATMPVREDDGTWTLSPLSEWTTDHVWEYLGYAQRGDYDAYSDFGAVFDLYAAASDGCLLNGGGGSACGARDGCVLCVAITEDKSLMRMIESNPGRYGYLSGLNRLRDYIAATQFDWNLRQWMSRDVDAHGYLTVLPSAYSPRMLADLLRYVLTLDAEEAKQRPAAPRFQIVSAQALIAIDYYWSLYGYQQPFEALSIYRDVYLRGSRYYPPVIEKVPGSVLPEPRYVYVGKDYADDRHNLMGMADPLLLMHREACGYPIKTLNGWMVPAIEDDRLRIDEEGACLVLDLELENLLSLHAGRSVSPTEAAQYYHRTGIVSIARGGSGNRDEMMRRTCHRWATGTLLFDRSDVEGLPLIDLHPYQRRMHQSSLFAA